MQDVDTATLPIGPALEAVVASAIETARMPSRYRRLAQEPARETLFEALRAAGDERAIVHSLSWATACDRDAGRRLHGAARRRRVREHMRAWGRGQWLRLEIPLGNFVSGLPGMVLTPILRREGPPE